MVKTVHRALQGELLLLSETPEPHTLLHIEIKRAAVQRHSYPLFALIVAHAFNAAARLSESFTVFSFSTDLTNPLASLSLRYLILALGPSLSQAISNSAFLFTRIRQRLSLKLSKKLFSAFSMYYKLSSDFLTSASFEGGVCLTRYDDMSLTWRK